MSAGLFVSGVLFTVTIEMTAFVFTLILLQVCGNKLGGKIMKEQIIPIERANEETINALIELGYLYVDENGLHVVGQEKTNN